MRRPRKRCNDTSRTVEEGQSLLKAARKVLDGQPAEAHQVSRIGEWGD